MAGRAGSGKFVYLSGPVKKLLLSALTSALVLVGGCDLPLDLPVWQTAWTLTGAVDTVTTQRILPEGVEVKGRGFVVEPVTSSRTALLGDVCPICTCYQGTVPPVTLDAQEWPLPFPNGLTRADLRSGQARLVLHNLIPFDLLDDGQGNTGFLRLTLLNRFTRTVQDSVVLEGSLPYGEGAEVSFDLAGLELTRGLGVRLEGEIAGSGCDTVSLEPEHGLRTDLVLDELEAAEVTVLVADESLQFPSRSLELPEVVSDRLRPQEARIVLEVTVESTVGIGLEILLSVAPTRPDLFGPDAALFTPILVDSAAVDRPVSVEKLFVLDLGRIQGADSVFIETQSRVEGNRAAVLTGSEGIRFTATLHSEIPSR